MLTNYIIYQNYVVLYFGSKTVTVYFNEHTGRAIKRKKNHVILKYLIDHKGIYLGLLHDGTPVVLHNHIDHGYAIVDTLTNFDNGIQSHFDDKTPTNDLYTVLNVALQEVTFGRPYDPLNHNCQTYVNDAFTNDPKSDDTGRVIAGALVATAAIGLLAALFGKK